MPRSMMAFRLRVTAARASQAVCMEAASGDLARSSIGARLDTSVLAPPSPTATPSIRVFVNPSPQIAQRQPRATQSRQTVPSTRSTTVLHCHLTGSSRANAKRIARDISGFSLPSNRRHHSQDLQQSILAPALFATLLLYYPTHSEDFRSRSLSVVPRYKPATTGSGRRSHRRHRPISRYGEHRAGVGSRTRIAWKRYQGSERLSGPPEPSSAESGTEVANRSFHGTRRSPAARTRLNSLPSPVQIQSKGSPSTPAAVRVPRMHQLFWLVNPQ